MTQDNIQISEAAENIVENLACRIARYRQGRIVPGQLLPFLPMSLDLIRNCLDHMVDGNSVLREDDGPLTSYMFTAYTDSAAREEQTLQTDSCVSCSRDLAQGGAQILCDACQQTLKTELTRLADSTGWPAQAVYEHEIFYLASRIEGHVHPADLAGKSRYTLKNMKSKLERISLDRYSEQKLDPAQGTLYYEFPEIAYPKDLFLRNMGLIRSYPESAREEIELKVTRILIVLALILIGCFVLAIFLIPFPICILIFIVAGSAAAFAIWSSREKTIEG